MARRRRCEDASEAAIPMRAAIETMREALRLTDPVLVLVESTPFVGGLLDESVFGKEYVDLMLADESDEAAVILHVAAALTPDEVAAARLRRALASRTNRVPHVVAQLAGAKVAEAWLLSEALGEHAELLLGIEWPGGVQGSLLAHLALDDGAVLVDAALIGIAAEAAMSRHREYHTAAGEPWRPARRLPLPQARSMVGAALSTLEATDLEMDPDDERYQWPAVVPLVIHFVARMPEDPSGEADEETERWFEAHEAAAALSDDIGDDPDALEVLADDEEAEMAAVEEALSRFLASAEGAALSDIEAAAAGLVFAYAAQEHGDPWHWTAGMVRPFLLGYLVENPVIPDRALDASPEILAAVLRAGRWVRGPGTAETEEALAEIPAARIEFERIRALPEVRAARRKAAYLDAILSGVPQAVDRLLLAEAVGEEAIDGLDTRPLPNEDLALAEVPADVRPIALAVSAHVDELVASGEFVSLDVEFRTACRRFLVRAARRDPAVLRGRSAPRTTAAAVAWTVGRANGLVGQPAPVRTKDLIAWFGLKSAPTPRSNALLAAYGAPGAMAGVVLGCPDSLVSAHRAGLVRKRDRSTDPVFFAGPEGW